MLTNITFVSFCIFSKVRRLETFRCFPGVLMVSVCLRRKEAGVV